MTDSVNNELRAALVQAVDLLFTNAVMSHSGHGNLSARADNERFLLTTTGTIRGLRADQLARVTLDGQVVEGELGPENTEIIAMHSTVYTTRPDVAAIIHTHSPAATAFALAHQPLPCRAEPLLRFGQAQSIPVVAWGPRGSEVSARSIAGVLAEHPTTNAVLLANHGLLAFGPDPVATARLITAIEETAEAEIAAASIGGAVDFPAGALEAVQQAMERLKH